MESRAAPKSNQPSTARVEESANKQAQAPSIQIEPAAGAAKDDAQPSAKSNSLPPPISTSTVMQSDENAIKNQKLVEEFQYLLEKSQSLFAGLRWAPLAVAGIALFHTHNFATTFSETFHRPVAIDNGNQ